jgi:hypothetical protein
MFGGRVEEMQRRFAGKRVAAICVAHATKAEYSVMRDRDAEYITRRLMLVQKSPITDGHPIKAPVQGMDLHIRLYDSMLLVPAKYKRLEAAAAILGEDGMEKIKISPFYKRNMDLFLERYPEIFERYALRDSELTLKLFLFLQRNLNEVVYGGPRRLFMTISGAGVSGFLESNPWFPGYKEKLDELLA